jgi:TolA-binding protein
VRPPRSPQTGTPSKRLIGLVVVLTLAMAVAAGCGGSGESAADRAKTNACDAVSDINKQVTTLKGLPLETSSVDTAKTAFTQIQTDLETISTQAETVSGDLKSQLQTANDTFKAQVQTAADSVTSAQSLTAAATAVSAAGQSLEAAYQQAFGSVKCD